MEDSEGVNRERIGQTAAFGNLPSEAQGDKPLTDGEVGCLLAEAMEMLCTEGI